MCKKIISTSIGVSFKFGATSIIITGQNKQAFRANGTQPYLFYK